MNLQMATTPTSRIMIPLVTILACILLQNNPVVGEALSKEYANKPKATLKTIKKQDGDIVDCVDIYKQPSLDHPLLKNHTIQHPSSSHSSFLNVAENELCPNGTIPIRRPFKDESARFPSSNDNRTNVNDELPGTLHKYASYWLKHTKRDMTAVSAKINVWRPSTNNAEFSAARISAGYPPERIEAGWMVSPNMYGDKEPRLFIHYVNNEHKSECYNIECKGFVIVESSFCLGCKITPYSVYNGDQYEINVALVQNQSTLEWWVEYQGQRLGYWPRQLFPGISQRGGVNSIEWGGEVTQRPYSPRPTSTHMGSGHFPSEGSGKAAYFQDIQFADSNFNYLQPDPETLQTILSHPRCYDVSQVFGDGEGHRINSHFYFGGSGGDSPHCGV